MESYPKQLMRRAQWLIHLRWLACIVVLAVVLLSFFVFRIRLPMQPLLILNFLFLIYNTLLLILLRKIPAHLPKKAVAILRWQLIIDYILLACFLHYSGGIENPFAFYFIFHVVFSSILFERKTAFIQTTFGVLLFISVVLLEYLQIIPHYAIFSISEIPLYENPVYLFAISCALISSLYFAAFVATNIAVELRQREIELKNANKSLTEQDRQKSEYVMMILHDLKEPIATVQNCVQLVLGGYCGHIDVKANETLSRSSKWLQKMIYLTHDLLHLSRIRMMPLVKLNPILLNKQIVRILSDYKKIFDDKALYTHFSLPKDEIWIKGDTEIFDHILGNLLLNAVKYTPQGGTIRVSLKKGETRIELDVCDSGIGIPAEYQDRVFNDFYRTPQAIEFDPQGTGLGLSIIKHGVELFGGSIKIVSPHDKEPPAQSGTCFCIEFPILKRTV
jgi:signal transduction histidine kinase